MANTFKLKTKENVAIDSGTHDSVYTVPAATTSVVLGLLLANQTSGAITATVTITTASSAGENADDPIILNAVAVPASTSLEVLSGQKLVLETGDVMKVGCSAASSMDVALSVMEIT